jgi:hypothetical protein
VSVGSGIGVTVGRDVGDGTASMVGDVGIIVETGSAVEDWEMQLVRKNTEIRMESALFIMPSLFEVFKINVWSRQ